MEIKISRHKTGKTEPNKFVKEKYKQDKRKLNIDLIIDHKKGRKQKSSTGSDFRKHPVMSRYRKNDVVSFNDKIIRAIE